MENFENFFLFHQQKIKIKFDQQICSYCSCGVCAGGWDWIVRLNAGRSPVFLPPGDANVSFEQFVDSLLSAWPILNQTASIFWTSGIPHPYVGHQCVTRQHIL